jgi:hypothetical protein
MVRLGSTGAGVSVSSWRNVGCWSRSGRRGTLGLSDARGWVVGARERPKKASTGEVLMAAWGAEG